MDQIIEYFSNLDPVLGAFYATLFTWGVTALGASSVFLFKSMSRMALDGMLGFTGGVMVAASFWSLLSPAIEMSAGEGFVKVMPSAIGFGLGALFIFAIDKVLPHLHINFKEEDAEGIKTPWRRTTLLTLAITLHNIPEGMSISVPILHATGSKKKAILYTALSGITEPIGALLVSKPEQAAISRQRYIYKGCVLVYTPLSFGLVLNYYYAYFHILQLLLMTMFVR